jgi:Putative zinc-finger
MKRDHPETCSEIQGHLPLYVGGDLEPEILDAVARHLACCEACRVASRAAEDARRVMGLALSGERVPDLWPGVRENLHAAGFLLGDRGAVVGTTEPGERRVLESTLRAGGPVVQPGVAAASVSRRSPGPLRRLRWAGLGTLAAAASIAGLVWLGGGPDATPVDGGSAPSAPPSTAVVVPAAQVGVDPQLPPVAEPPAAPPRISPYSRELKLVDYGGGGSPEADPLEQASAGVMPPIAAPDGLHLVDPQESLLVELRQEQLAELRRRQAAQQALEQELLRTGWTRGPYLVVPEAGQPAGPQENETAGAHIR